MNLSAVRIFVNDVAEAERFYVDQLGLTLETKDLDHGVCILNAGGPQLVIEAVAKDAPQDEQVLVGRFTGVSFAVGDIRSKHQQLSALDVQFSGEPEQQHWGGWLATLKDPSGNELQLVQLAD